MDPNVRGRDLPGGVNVAPEGLGDAIAAKRASRAMDSTEEMTGKMVLPIEEPPTPTVPDSHTDPERETYERFHDNKSGNAAHTREIDQGLQSTIQSAITDIEKDLDQGEFQKVVEPTPQINGDRDENKENQAMVPQQNGDTQNGTNGYHHEDDQLGPMIQHGNPVRLRLPHEFKGKVRPMSMPAEMTNFEPMGLPEVGMNGPRKVMQPFVADNTDAPGVQAPFKPQMQMVQTKSQSSSSMSYSKTSSSTMVIDAGPDTGSLKRRNPKQMFTDSAFYSPQHHPSVQEQVEMAHRLSSSLYDEGNRTSVGQEMFMKRAKKSGDGFTTYEDDEPPRHDKVPNLKLVMNPDGKLHDWTDLPEEELPEMQILAQGGASPDTAHHVVENLEACKGRGGELFAKRKEKAEKWVIDETSLGRDDPRRYADKYVQQQTMHQEQVMREKEMEMQRKMQEQQRLKEESYQRQMEEQREREQMIRAQAMEQQQQMAMRHQKTRQAIQKQQGAVRTQAQETTPAWVKQPQQLQNPGMYGGHSAFKEPRNNIQPTVVDGGPFHHKNQQQGNFTQSSQQQYQQRESNQSQSFQQHQQFDQFQQQQLQQHSQSYQSMPQPDSYRPPTQIQPSFSSSLPPPMALREVELPASVKPCSLKGHLFTPKFDDSIHNVHGINVWTAKMPKPWGSKSSTLPRSSRITENYSGSRKSSIEVSRSVPRESEMPSLESMQPKETRFPSEPRMNNFQQPQLVSSPSFQQTTKPKSPPRRESQPPMEFESQLEAEKYREYEEWMKAQAKEQETLEYDCSVKYVEKQAPHEQPQMPAQPPSMVQSFQAQQTSEYRYSEERIVQQQMQQTIQRSASTDQLQQPQQQGSFDQDQNREAAEERQAADQARMEQEEAERQRQEQEEFERQRQEQEALERQKQEQEAADRQRQEQEELERQRLEQEALERQRQEQEALERQRQEQEALERQRQEQEALERQRQEQEALERQRQEQEALERQRQEQEALERQQQEQEALERQRQEQQAAEQRAAEEEYQRQMTAAEEARHLQEQEEQRSQHEQQLRQQQEDQTRQQQEQIRQQEQFRLQQEQQQQQQMQWQQQQVQLAQPTWQQPSSQGGNYSVQSSSMSQSQSYSFQAQMQSQQAFGLSSGQQPVQFQNYHHSESQQKQSSTFQASSSTAGAEYSTSLRPTTTGALIRTQGDIHFTTAPSQQEYRDETDNSTFSSLRRTEFGEQLRQTGSIGRPRLYGEEDQDVSPFSSLRATEFGQQLRVKGDIEKSPSGLQQNYDMENQQRHSVKNLVEHFKQAAPPPDMISRPVKRQEMILPQVQPLQSKPQFSPQPQSVTVSDQHAFQQSQSNLSNSHIADYCTIDGSYGGLSGLSGGIQDPSAILGGMRTRVPVTNTNDNPPRMSPDNMMEHSPFANIQPPPNPRPSSTSSLSAGKPTTELLKANFDAMMADLNAPLPPIMTTLPPQSLLPIQGAGHSTGQLMKNM